VSRADERLPARKLVRYPGILGSISGATEFRDPASPLTSEGTMRYRRLSYRYTMTVRSSQSWPIGHDWPGDRARVLAHPRWRPDTDTYETPMALEVIVDLAGVDEDDVELQLFQDALVIEGRRLPAACQEGAVYQAVGIRHGPFRVEVPLPAPVDLERVEARFHRGFLRVTLPKLRASG